MVMNTADIQKGMEVFGSDGEKIGEVAEVYPNAGAGATGTAGPSETTGVGPAGTAGTSGMTDVTAASETAGTDGTGDLMSTPETTAISGMGGVPGTAGTMTATGYFKVDQGGILGIGAKHLYFPFSAVTAMVPGDNVTVTCAKDQCDDLYGTKPDFLEGDGTDTPLSS